MVQKSATIVGAKRLASYYMDKSVVDSYIGERFTDLVSKVVHQKQVETLNVAISRTEPQRILEIAPGPARVTRYLRGRGQLIAIDSSKEMLLAAGEAMECAGNWLGQWEFVHGDAFDLSFEDASVQLVFGFRFFQHFRYRERCALFSEVRRVLQGGGLFIFNAINGPLHRRTREAAPERFPIYDKLYERGELERELAEAGFTMRRLHPALRRPRLQYRIERAVSRLSRNVAGTLIESIERLPGGNPSGWIVECAKV